MKTIRTTAIRTEKIRSRNHETALHRLERAGTVAQSVSGVGAGTGIGLLFSCIPDLLRHYRRFAGWNGLPQPEKRHPADTCDRRGAKTEGVDTGSDRWRSCN